MNSQADKRNPKTITIEGRAKRGVQPIAATDGEAIRGGICETTLSDCTLSLQLRLLYKPLGRETIVL